MKLDSLIKSLILSATCFACTEQVKVTVSNSHTEIKHNQNVEIQWDSLRVSLPQLTVENLVIIDENKNSVPYQVVKDVTNNPIAVLVQMSMEPQSKSQLLCSIGTPAPFKSNTFGRFVPERKDDFAWENNKVAFRMYGPALEHTGEISNGIDVWAKRTEELVVDKWYKKDDYHKDHGEGLDYYKVGRTLGAGMMAPILDSSFVLGNNYVSYEVIENGPLRTTFKLLYAPFKVGEYDVTEERIISLSANSHFNKVTVTYSGNFETLPVGAGIILRGNRGKITENAEKGFITYEEPEMGTNGRLFLSVIMNAQHVEYGKIDGHLVAKTVVKSGEPISYYTGNGWSKAGVMSNDQWQQIINDQIANDLQLLNISYK
ncbi:MAG: DUF4861 family protein [Marinifilaceae bacterium]